MFLKKKIPSSSESYLEQIDKFKKVINDFDTIIIGAGSGLSTSAGLTYSGERFEKYFPDFIEKYRLSDMYSAGFFPYKTLEEHFAYWSRHIYYNRYKTDVNSTYDDLKKLVQEKNYFVITTNVDHLFQKSGFDKKRLFYTQGDYGLWQCSKPCHKKTYDNEDNVLAMINEQKDMKIPKELIPLCPICKEPMTTNLRKDHTFVQDFGWDNAMKNYEKFIVTNRKEKVLFLDLGIGLNTPSIIKYPFWQMTYDNENAFYVSVNLDYSQCPKEIAKRSLCINEDIGKTIGLI